MIRPLVQSVSPPPSRFDPTFVDPKGVTHETLGSDRAGDVSMCGQPRRSSGVKRERHATTLRAYARSLAPEGVDCMSCLVRRVRLDNMIQGPQPENGHLVVDLDLANETSR